jgi:hypothetical protein
MKKFFLFAITMMMAINVQAQREPTSATSEGIEKTRRSIEAVKLMENQYYWWQNANGETEYLRLNGLKPGIGVSCEYYAKHFVPKVSLSLEMDGRGWWTKQYTSIDSTYQKDGQTVYDTLTWEDKVRLFTYEVEVSLYPGFYADGAASAGKMYLAADMMAYLKCQLYQNDWQTVRLNLIVGAGANFIQHDEVDDFGEWMNPNDGAIYHLTDHISHMGLGFAANGGLGTSIRCSKHSASRLEIKALAGIKANNVYHKTQVVPTAELAVAYHFAVRAHVKPARLTSSAR